MANFHLAADEKLPFVRQIQDYYKYSSLGSTWMVIGLEFTNFDENKFGKIYFDLLNEQTILRNVFVKKSDGLITRKTISTSLFVSKTFSVKDYNEIVIFFDSFHKENRFYELCNPLTKLFIFNHLNKSYIFICINHIICDRHSLDKIRDEIIKKYKNIDYTFNFYDFDKFSNTRNSNIFNKFNSDYSFFKKKFNHHINNNVNNINEEQWLKDICNKKYNYYLQNRKPLAFDSLIKLEKNKLVYLNIKSLVIYALLRVQRDFFGDNNYLGFLFRDSIQPNFSNCIGQLTAEGAIFCNIINKNSKISFLDEVNKELISSYRKPIFNYSMYDLDELYLEKNKIPIFLNYNKTNIDYFDNQSYEIRDFFYESPTVKSFIEPNIIYYQNGNLLCRWIFDENKISRKEMIKFKDLFNFYIKEI